MKKILSLAVAALFASAAAFAQNDYNRINVGYQSLAFYGSLDYALGSHSTLDGVKLGYIHGFSLSKDGNLFLQTGLDAIFNTKEVEIVSFYSNNFNVASTNHDMAFALDIPINLAYKFNFRSGRVFIEPFAGFLVKANLMGKTKVTYEPQFSEYNSNINWFKDADMSNQDILAGGYVNYLGGKTCRRFQYGAQVGLNIGFCRRFNVSAAYQWHSPLQKVEDFKLRTNSFTLSLGYNF